MAFGTVHNLHSQQSLLESWIGYCEERGLTPEMLAPMRGELLTIEAASKLVGAGIFGFKSIGALGAFVYPIAEDEYQARIIYSNAAMDPIPKPGEQAKPVKLTKYFRAKNSANYLYIPKHLTDWFNQEASYNLLIVEGALNAVRLAASGYHAVGITGVYNYHTGGKTTPIIPEIIRLTQGKQVERITILFDSDTADQDNKRALWNGIHSFSQDLMKLRTDRRNTIYLCRPPVKSNGDKCGPDDYLQATNIDEFNRLIREESLCYSDSPYLKVERSCIDRFIFDELSGQPYDTETRQLIKKDHANLIMMTMGEVDDILAVKPSKITYNVDRLLKNQDVRIAHGQRFQPDVNDPYFLDETTEPQQYRINKFSPLDVPKSIKGSVDIAYEMLNSICRDSPSAVDKIVRICAHHAQYPAHTPKYGILLAGEQRAGKSNFARLVGRALSKRYHEARVNLSIDFNSDWRGFACKEWAEFDKNMDEEWLKDLITGESYMVSVKYGTNYSEKNYTLNIFTCNGLQSKLQDGDSRFIIAGYAKPDNKKLGLEFERWVNSQGPNYFRYHLLNDIDASGYDDIDVNTEMRDSVIEASQSYKSTVKDYILEELAQMPELECIPNMLTSMLLEPYKVNTMSFMKLYGQYFVKPGTEIVKIDGVHTRFRAFKNTEKWKKETDTDKYREQYKLAKQLMEELIKHPKF